MRRTTLGAVTLATILAAAVVPLSAAGATTASAPSQQAGRQAERAPDQIPLPDGWQPEGITTDGRALYAGSLADGAIWKASPKTGRGAVLAAGATGRVAVGIDYDRKRDLLWVAGGPTGLVRAQDADTGAVLATYDFSDKARFLNDLTVTRRAVLVTDSMNQELAVVPFGKYHHKAGRLPPAAAAKVQPLTGDLVYTDGFNLNGIVKVQHRVVAVQSNTGLLFRINQRTGTTRQVDLGGALLTNGDGLESLGRTLYVVRNQDNLIAEVRLHDKALAGHLVDELAADSLDVPATVALVRNALWAANARFNTEPTPTTPYWITRVPLH